MRNSEKNPTVGSTWIVNTDIPVWDDANSVGYIKDNGREVIKTLSGHCLITVLETPHNNSRGIASVKILTPIGVRYCVLEEWDKTASPNVMQAAF